MHPNILRCTGYHVYNLLEIFQKKNLDTGILLPILITQGFPGGSVVKNPLSNAGDVSSIPGLGRSPGEGNGNSLQYSCQGNPMDRGVWLATVGGVTEELNMTRQLNKNNICIHSHSHGVLRGQRVSTSNGDKKKSGLGHMGILCTSFENSGGI